jgi:hypothetical protein
MGAPRKAYRQIYDLIEKHIDRIWENL